MTDRRTPGRQVYSRGPIIRALEIATAVCSVCSLIALLLSVSLFLGRIDEIQGARYDAFVDMCYAVRAVAIRAYPPSAQAEVRIVLKDAGLGDCVAKAHSVVHTN